jgi:putative DNA primase/helicase
MFARATAEMQEIAKQLEGLEDGPAQDGLKAKLAHLQRMQKWALKSEAAPRINGMLDLARSERGIPVLPAALDQDAWLLNVANGTVELVSGQLREHRREDMITKLCPTAYHPDAACPVWERTLLAIFNRKPDLVGYVQRLLGYCLTGDVSEQILAILWGRGSNGKSLLINTFMDVLGTDYAQKGSRDLFMAHKSDNHPTALADLHGRRFVACVETREGGRLDEALIKELTGSDPIKARYLYREYFHFRPSHKCVLATNHKPKIRGTDDGIWRRPRLIPFTVRFWDPDKGESGPEHLKADKRLPERLKAEYPGILAWCVRGCLDWQRGGLRAPSEVVAATTQYRGEQDLVAAFLTECCLTGADYRCKSAALWERFSRWQEQAGEPHAVGRTAFGEALVERGYRRYTNNGTWYEGLKLP